MASVTHKINGATIHTGPTMSFTGNVTISRSSEQSSSVSISISGTISMPYGGQYDKAFSGQGLSASFNTTNNSQLHGNHQYISNGSQFNESFTATWTEGSGTVYINCRFGSKSDPSWHCDQGSNNVVLSTFSISELPYNPYTKISTFTLNSVSPSIGIANETIYTANYTISGGTEDLTRRIYKLWFRINNIT